MRFLLCLLALGLACARLAGADISPEARECFDWFATLGHPDPKDAPWAEVWAGNWFQSGGSDTREVETSHGFVIRENADTFQVMGLDLTERMLTKTGPGTPPHERVGLEKRDFLKMAKARLNALQHPPKHFNRFGAKLGHKAETFVLAYVCWRKGEVALAQQFYDEAAKLPDDQLPMREALELELGHAAMWDAVLHVGGGNLAEDTWGRGKLVSRTELLAKFRDIVRLYPRSKHIERARKTIEILERMVAEDAAHQSLSKEEFARLTIDKKVAELIFQLRDQNGHQWGQPGWCDIFDMQTEGKSPAHQLVELGYAAVPQLIDALDDERFSRSVGFHRDFHFSHTILTIGDCAQQILNRIAGQSFYAPRTTSSYMSRDQEIAATQKVVREWWAGFQKKGKKPSLIDDISSGKIPPGMLVTRLRELDAKAAEQAVLDGAAKAKEPWLMQQFIYELARLKGDAATKQLLARMKDGTEVSVRLAAATALFNADHPEALPAIVAEWRSRSGDDGANQMIRLLAASGKAAAMNEVVKDWDLRPVDERLEIVSILGEMLRPSADDQFYDVKLKPMEPEARAIGMRLLVHALEDTGTRDGMSGSWGDYSFTDPRICDVALYLLNRIDAKIYAFSPKANRHHRETERIVAANVWRRQHHQDLLPLPVPKPKLPESDALKISHLHVKGGEEFAKTPLVEQITALKGTKFTAKTLPQLLLWFARNPTEGACGLAIEVLREGDLTGVEVRIEIQSGPYPATGDWRIHHSGRFGTSHLGSSSSSAALSHARDEKFWEDFTDDVAKGLQVPATTEFEVRASIVGLGL